MSKLVLIPNFLGIATYILGTAAGVKLLSSWAGKISSGVACVLCLLAYPFVGAALWIPVLVAIGCVLYLTWRKNANKEPIYEQRSNG